MIGHFTHLLIGSSNPPRHAMLAPTMVMFLVLLGTLGLLIVLTMIRSSLKRAGRLQSGSKRAGVPESAWSVAGKRARPIDADEGRAE